MPSANTPITSAWTQIATDTDSSVKVSWDYPVQVEVTTTATNMAPTVAFGHRFAREQGIDREDLAPGYVWARLIGGSPVSQITVCVSTGSDDVVGYAEAGAALISVTDTSVANTTYFCQAKQGTAESAAAWRITRTVVSGNVSRDTYAGSGGFDQVCADRLSLTYS